MFKKIVFFATVFFCGVLPINALEEIQVSLSQERITLGENIILEIAVDTQKINSNTVNLEIEGIENFQIFSQSRSESYENINGTANSKMIFTLDIQPISLGTFTLGPVKLITDGETFSDDGVFQIEVSDYISTPTEKIPEEVIEDIKPLRDVQLSWGVIISLIGLFMVIFYSVLLMLFSQKNTSKVTHIPQENDGEKNKKLILYLRKLKKRSEEVSSQDFFRKYNTILRELLLRMGTADALSASLKELTKHKNISHNEYFQIFQKSYEYEFISSEVPLDTRVKFIDDLIKLLK